MNRKGSVLVGVKGLDECCALDESKHTPASALIASFKDFSGWKGLSDRRFGDMLKEKGFKKKRSNGICWQGIYLDLEQLEPLNTFSAKSYREKNIESLGKTPSNVPTVPFSTQEEFFLEEEDIL